MSISSLTKIVTWFALLWTVCFSAGVCYAQGHYKKLSNEDLVMMLTSEDTTELILDGYEFLSYRNENLHELAPNDKSRTLKSQDSLIGINRKVVLVNCVGLLNFANFHFKKGILVNLKELDLFNYSSGSRCEIKFIKCAIDKVIDLNIQKNETARVRVVNCQIRGEFRMRMKQGDQCIIVDSEISVPPRFLTMYHVNEYGFMDTVHMQRPRFNLNVNANSLTFSNNNLKFNFENEESKFQVPELLKSQPWPASPACSFYFDSERVEFVGNRIESLPPSVKAFERFFAMEISTSEKTKELKFIDNTITNDVILNLGAKLESLNFHGNVIERLGLEQFEIPYNNRILWTDFDQSQLGLMIDNYGEFKHYYTGDGLQLEDKLAYGDLIKFYKRFYDNYRSIGNIQSANTVYVKIKDLETRMLVYEFEQRPSFNFWFRVKLNQLIRVYTQYGTDPARAIVYSFWVIVSFALLYFFFPSTWEESTKSALIRKFKDFLQKNEKGYIKPFFVLSLSLLVSLINALTLSLNAFTTLGFGEIPAKGVAKYVAVIQGFIGWFLLSIFTVALINQSFF